MMKIFQRIRRNLVKESKVMKYLIYALGEIILVVVGILIAIQINGTYEASKNRAKEKALLIELSKEASENLEQFKKNKKAYQSSLRASEILLRNVATMDQQPSKDSILMTGPGVFRGITFDPTNGIIESLISTGEIQLIRNDTLRNYLITWKDVLKDFQEEEEQAHFLWKNTVEPYLIKHGDFLNPSSQKNIDLCRDQKFLNMVARRQFYIYSILGAMESESIEFNLKEIVRLSKINR